MGLRRSFVTRPALDITLPPASRAAAARLEALLDDFQPFAIEELSPRVRRVHFLTATARDDARQAIGRELRDFGVSAASVDVDDEDWARQSQASLRAVRVGDIVVAPPWDVPDQALGARPSALGTSPPSLQSRVPSSQSPAVRSQPQRPPSPVLSAEPTALERRRSSLAPSGISESSRGPTPARGGLVHPHSAAAAGARLAPIVIVIEPSMGFGTGHHASTRLCLGLMQTLDFSGKTVLDVGTGSGVLAIAAYRLGGTRVMAIDVDADAIESARRNLATNGISVAIDLVVGDVRTMPYLPAADVVLANLTGAMLAEHGALLGSKLRPRDHLIVSGFTIEDESDVTTALSRSATLIRREVEDEWVAVHLQKR